MVDTAARLTDEILPAVPVRQWVLSMPFEIRYRLAWDGDLVSAVLAVFLRVVYGWYRRQSKKQGHGDGRCGSVTFVQRFGSALNCNPHFHVLMPDGVYVTGTDGAPTFVRAPALTDEDVQQIVETTAKRVVRLLQRRGLLEEDTVDPLWEEGAPAGHDHGCFGPGAGGHRRSCRATSAAPAARFPSGRPKRAVVLFFPRVFPACGHLSVDIELTLYNLTGQKVATWRTG